MAPPCEKPASTIEAAGTPRAFSRSINASIAFWEARTPPASSRRRPPSSRMSYQARITWPPLIVTGRIGACGNTNRTPGRAGKWSSGTTSTKSWPSAPSPCIQTMLAVGAGAVSISTASSRSATLRCSRDDGSRQRHGGTRCLGEVERLERRRRPPVAVGQGRQPEPPLDELQDRGVIVLSMADDAALSQRRHDERRHARAEPEVVHRGRAYVIEPAPAFVVGDDHGDARPVAARHHLSHHLADPAVARAHRRGHRVGVVLPVRLHERHGWQAAVAERPAELRGVPDVGAALGCLHDAPHVLERVVWGIKPCFTASAPPPQPLAYQAHVIPAASSRSAIVGVVCGARRMCSVRCGGYGGSRLLTTQPSGSTSPSLSARP